MVVTRKLATVSCFNFNLRIVNLNNKTKKVEKVAIQDSLFFHHALVAWCAYSSASHSGEGMLSTGWVRISKYLPRQEMYKCNM